MRVVALAFTASYGRTGSQQTSYTGSNGNIVSAWYVYHYLGISGLVSACKRTAVIVCSPVEYEVYIALSHNIQDNRRAIGNVVSKRHIFRGLHCVVFFNSHVEDINVRITSL